MLLLGNGIPVVTFILLIVEDVLGWFAFSVNVLSSYPFMVARAAAPMPGLSDTQSKALIMMVVLAVTSSSMLPTRPHAFMSLYDCEPLSYRRIVRSPRSGVMAGSTILLPKSSEFLVCAGISWGFWHWSTYPCR